NMSLASLSVLPMKRPVIIEADCHESYSRPQRRKGPDMHLIFEQIHAGGDRNFGDLLGDRDTRQSVLIDPSYSPKAFVQRSKDQGLTVTHIINTHGHPDHTNGNTKAVELTAAPVAAFADPLLGQSGPWPRRRGGARRRRPTAQVPPRAGALPRPLGGP